MGEGCFDFSGNPISLAVAQSTVRIIFDEVLGNLRTIQPTCHQLTAPSAKAGGSPPGGRQNVLTQAISSLVDERKDRKSK